MMYFLDLSSISHVNIVLGDSNASKRSAHIQKYEIWKETLYEISEEGAIVVSLLAPKHLVFKATNVQYHISVDCFTTPSISHSMHDALMAMQGIWKKAVVAYHFPGRSEENHEEL
jgi:hypothetical protein